MGYILAMDDALITVIETTNFIRRAERIMSDDERKALIDHLAANPTDGEELGSGVRKMRFGTAGRGKRGAVRVVHFFADSRFPVFLLDVFAKNEKANYSAAELAVVRKLAHQLIGTYRKEAMK